MKVKIKLLLLATVAAATVQAQLPTEEVDIVKQYRPVLSELEKIQVKAEAPPRDTTIVPVSYRPLSLILNTPFTPADVKPLAVPSMKEAPLNNHVIKAGFGTQWSPVLGAYLSSNRSSAFHYGLHADYTSASAAQQPFQDFSSLQSSLFGTSYFKNIALNGEVAFDRMRHRYYAFENGFSDTLDFLTDERLRFTLTGIGAGLSVYNTASNKADMDYRLFVEYHHLEQQATPVQVDTYLYSSWRPAEDVLQAGLDIGKKITEESRVSLLAAMQTDGYRSERTDTSMQLFTLSPQYAHAFRSVRVVAGLSVFAGNELFGVFPQASVHYRISGDLLSAYGVLQRRYKLHGFGDILKENPFILDYQPFRGQSTEAAAGLRGVYADNLSYNVLVRYNWWHQLPFYYPVYATPIYYKVVPHSRGTTLAIGGEVQYRLAERVSVELSGEAGRWRPDSLEHPIGVITQKGKLAVEYLLQEKIRLRAAVIAHTGAYTITPAGDTLRLKGVVDPNLTVTYNYKPWISFWLAGYNLANMKQRQWYGYTSYGIRAAAGVFLKF